MPIYEEKLICPLAVRFTQELVRPIFQNKVGLDATIKDIKTRPGTGGYDLILEAPFPNIELVRWFQKDQDDSEPDAEHWFTLDNRRLYCLQRVAADLWPRRVAVVVEVLYAATDGIRRKDDSLTVGRSVGIGHSMKALTGRWDWRTGVLHNFASAAAAMESSSTERAAYTLVEKDDARCGVKDLSDAPAPPSMLERYLQGSTVVEPVLKNVTTTDSSSDRSTAYPASPRSASESDKPEHLKSDWLCGKWRGQKGELYEICSYGVDSWSCWRTDRGSDGKATVLWVDEQSDAIWWGSEALAASEFRRANGRLEYLTWYVIEGGSWKPRCYWEKASKSADVSTGQQANAQKKTFRPAPRKNVAAGYA